MPEAAERDKVVFLHTPKTGGTWLQGYLLGQCRSIRRNYFLSFFGTDESAEYRDALATQRPQGNRFVIERAFELPEMAAEVRRSPHFQQAKLLFGHVTCGSAALFPGYRFQYLTVLREPVERTISMILQYSAACDDGVVKFGAFRTRAPKYSAAYWDFIYDVLTDGYPVPELAIHENCQLRNGMTRVLQGTRYLDPHEPPDLRLALVNAMRIQISFFDDLLRGLQRSFDALAVPVRLPANLGAGQGKAYLSEPRRQYGPYVNAPQKVIDFVREQNQIDVQLYALLKERIDGAPSAGQ